jgi:hypothetical protein
MQDDENPVSSQLKRTPWNKGKLMVRNLRSDRNTFGQ